MKKTILKLLRGDGSEANNCSLDRKELRKAACKLHTEIEDKADRKERFNESLAKLESKGKIVVENSTVKLIAPSAQCNETVVDECELNTAKEAGNGKKRKVKQLDTDEVQVDEGSKKKKAAKATDKTEKKSKSGNIRVIDEVQAGEGSKKKKAAKATDEIEGKSNSTEVCVATPAVSADIGSDQSVKKEYPPVEAQTGVNTILLFYAYCVPVMSRGMSL